ncbi:hypothetical protein A2116_01030 [Candidatus Jorgensenbacteria bacterium GWA1_49_17]|uniref:Transcriptional repressor PaaX-like central Cas2-like domain-containing protein n=1 Tax=Candidatus Jorgensenbacteria bacterium GWA1_49_17 TaxID=1798467 RepID=A0A1F6BU84_9BACT|nr:MAG: hypothetical protein A2116_01030 [Candidatus Jorgensenbacteria bacterium GWA1_49_17]
MAKTARDARRHIRELSQFFADVKFVTEQAVDDFLKQHQQKVYLKQSLKRLETRRFLIRREDAVYPTKSGSMFFRKQKLLADKKSITKNWDGKWRLISFDVPVGDDKKRYQLRSLLKEFDFYQLHKSVWVCPNQLAENFWKLIIDSDLDKYCKVMTVDIIEGDEGLIKHFKL